MCKKKGDQETKKWKKKKNAARKKWMEKSRR